MNVGYGQRGIMIMSEQSLFRELLWLHHGCPVSSLYGDDGEMQCLTCLIDFKRDSAQVIEQKLLNRTLQRLENHTREVILYEIISR